MEIRRISLADVPAFIALWKRVYLEGTFLERGPPPEEHVMSVVGRVVRESIPNFIATDGDSLIGAAEIFPGTLCGQTHEGADRTGHLGIQVELAYRRKGVGQALLKTAIADARRYGFEAVELYVFQSNLAAIHLYESMGFTANGLGKEVILPAGINTQGQHMILPMNP